MENRQEKRHLLITMALMSFIVISMGLQIIFSPYMLVRGISLFSVIILSCVIGAFIKDWFHLNTFKREADFIEG